MSDLPKMLSKREIELEELEEAKYVQSLRDDIEKLQEQLNTAKKALTEIINANDNLFLSVHGRGDLDSALDNARKALEVIGENDE
ncbi:hypothetical protein [Lactococcus lactis]|uniref:hypothetical protein n=3 Tax=Lactococcus lactis TaxID=1358 RepID=UPI003D2EBD24